MYFASCLERIDMRTAVIEVRCHYAMSWYNNSECEGSLRTHAQHGSGKGFGGAGKAQELRAFRVDVSATPRVEVLRHSSSADAQSLICRQALGLGFCRGRSARFCKR